LTEGLGWPPKKEDLMRLYLIEKLSAAKIARAYGLRYKTPKVAESTVLYQLRKSGIKRRNPAEHIRKVTEEMADDWMRRYQAGESLKQIAGELVDPVTVWNHLRRRGVVLRDKVEAQIQAVLRHERKPFEGDDLEKAYLIGLRYGDLDAVRHGRAIRVRVSTTHPAMAELFESLFSPYGFVHKYPRVAQLTSYEWTLECDLDATFEFLLKKPSIAYLSNFDEPRFLAFLAGLFDAEGSVLMHRKGSRYDPEVAISNTDRSLIEYLSKRLERLGFFVCVMWRRATFHISGRTGQSEIGRLAIWRFREAQEFLGLVRLRHREKVGKTRLVMSLRPRGNRESREEVLEKWLQLRTNIESERKAFIRSAGQALLSRSSERGSGQVK
jgi:hypothetical protein